MVLEIADLPEVSAYGAEIQLMEDLPREDRGILDSLIQRPPAAKTAVGDRLIKHTRYFWLLLAESDLTR